MQGSRAAQAYDAALRHAEAEREAEVADVWREAERERVTALAALKRELEDEFAESLSSVRRIAEKKVGPRRRPRSGRVLPHPAPIATMCANLQHGCRRYAPTFARA